MPDPTSPPWVGSWPEPPPETRATLFWTGASARTSTLYSGIRRSRPGWASSIPRHISSTTLSGTLITFFIFFLSRKVSGQRRLDGLLCPVLGPVEGFLPAPIEPLALLLAHLRLVAAPEPPPVLKLLAVLPEAGREPCQVRGAKGGGLQRLRHLHGDAEDVGLKLHHPPVCGRPAVSLERRDLEPRVVSHRLDRIAGLVAHALQRRPCQVRPRGAACEPDQGAPGVRVPVRRPEAHQRRDEVHVVVRVEAPGELLGLGGALDNAKAVPEPLHRRPGYEDGALKRVLDRLVAEAPGDGGQEVVLALYGLGTGVHEGKGTGAVGVLGEPLLEGDLAKEGRLLVSSHAGDGHLRAEDVCVSVPVDVGARLDLRQHLSRPAAKHLEEVVVPPEVEDVVHHGARGVLVVGDVLPPAGQLVDQPGIYGAEGELAVLRPLLQAVYVLQQPLDLRAGEVRVYNETALVRNHLVVALLRKRSTDRRAPPVLPNHGVVDRLTSLPIPHDHCLALVGDPDRRYILRRYPGVLQRLPHNIHGDVPDLTRVVLDPARLRVMLRELLLGLPYRGAVMIEDYGPARRGPLIYSQNVVPCHTFPFP